MNRLNQIGGAGKTVVEGTLNEPANVTVGGQLAQVSSLPGTSDFKFQKEIPVNQGTNNFQIIATDAKGNARTQNYSVQVGTAQKTYEYDSNGNLLREKDPVGTIIRSFEWDGADRLKAVNWGAQRIEWTYNGVGQRVLETVNGVAAKRYLWDGIAILLKKTPTGVITKRLYGEGEQRVGGPDAGNYHYTRDHLGSIREVVNQAGALQARYDYNAYGTRSTVYQNSAYLNGCIFGYTGHITLPSLTPGHSELVLTHFRAYDPHLGRWLSADPIGEKGGLNLYGYGPGNPVGGYDPNGGVWHHLIPFTGGLDAGLSADFINSLSNGWDMSNEAHKQLHAAGWTAEWNKFFSKCGNTSGPAATKKLSELMGDPRFSKILEQGGQALDSYPCAAKRLRKYYKSRMGLPGISRASIGLSLIVIAGAYNVRSEFLNAAEAYIEGGDNIDKLTAMAIIAEATNFTTAGYMENALEEALQDRLNNQSQCP